MLTGEVKDPKISTLLSIAGYFSISIDKLLGKETPEPRFELNSECDRTKNKIISDLSVLSLNEANEYEKFIASSTHKIQWIVQGGNQKIITQKNIFAVCLKNNVYDPPFVSSTHLIINPNIAPANGDYVLVKFNVDNEPVIKKYISEGHQKYLYPLKQDLKSIQFNQNEASIIGVIIESYLKLKY